MVLEAICSHSGSPLAILKIPGKLREGILDNVFNYIRFFLVRGVPAVFEEYIFLHTPAPGSGRWLSHTSRTTSSNTKVISSEVAEDLGELQGKAVGKTKQAAKLYFVSHWYH